MSETTEVDAWPGAIAAITLFVEDLDAAKGFYQEVFRLPVFFEDESSAVFKFGETLINLLQASEAPGLVAPARVAPADADVRFQFTLDVENVDAMCDELQGVASSFSTGRWIAPGASEQRASEIRVATSGRWPPSGLLKVAPARRCESRRVTRAFPVAASSDAYRIAA